jgi:hypothetical protein
MSGGWREDAACLRLGSVGLSPKDRLLLRSVVQIVRTQTRHRWEFSEQPPYDVTFLGSSDSTDTDSQTASQAALAGLVIRVVTHDDERVGGDASLSITTPIRPHNLLPLLDALGDRSPRGAVARSIPVERRQTPRLSSIGGPAGRAYAFVERLQRRDRASFLIFDGDQPLIVVHPATKTWSTPAEGDSASAADIAARLLARPLPLRTVDFEVADDRFVRVRARRLEVLLWHLGLLADPHILSPTAAQRTWLKLSRWPDFGSIGKADPLSLKLSAMLANRAYRFQELLDAVEDEDARSRVVAFLNACAMCDLLVADVVPREPARATPLQFGKVMRMLRTALGISGA